MLGIISNGKYFPYYQRINQAYQRPEVKASLEVILSVFTAVVLIFAAVRPTLVNIATLQKKVEDQEALNRKAENKIAQLFNAQTQLSTHRNSLRLYDEAIPNLFSYYGVAARLEFLAKKNGVEVENVAMPGTRVYGTTEPKADWAAKLVIPDSTNLLQTGVGFSISGRAQNVISMIEEIENMDRLTRLENIVFSKEQTQGSTGRETLRATGQINFYFYRPVL